MTQPENQQESENLLGRDFLRISFPLFLGPCGTASQGQ